MKLKKLSLNQKKLKQIEAKLSVEAQKSKSLKEWFQFRWGQFETWVHSWYPGVKTRITLWLGMLGSAAATLQDYVSGLPITDYISTKSIAVVTLGLFTLAFWFRGMGDRVEARAEEIN